MRHLIAWHGDGALAHRADELATFATHAHQEALAAHPTYSR
ncbi:hypothetical protein AB0L44_25025 [Nonomuraea wenchangensis]